MKPITGEVRDITFNSPGTLANLLDGITGWRDVVD
jgi:hypothetical protein